MNKPIFPYAPGQAFKNLTYRRVSGQDVLARRDFIAKCLGLSRVSRLFFTEPVVNAIQFGYDSSRSRSLGEASAGYPIHPKVSDKLFQFLEPAGYWSKSISSELTTLMRDLPMVHWSLLKSVRSHLRSPKPLPAGDYISVGRIQNGATRSPNFEFYYSRGGQHSHVAQRYDGDYAHTMYDLTNIFLPSFNFTAGVDLFLLPTNSLVWIWSEEKWVPGSVSVEVAQGTKDKIRLSVLEILGPDNEYGFGKVLYSATGTELAVHKKIAKLINSDDIRIAVKGVLGFSLRNTPAGLSPQITKMLASDYSLPVLETFKMRALGSTAYKSCQSFESFAEMYAKQRPLLAPRSIGASASYKRIREFVYRAAADKAPLFWGVTSLLRAGVLQGVTQMLADCKFETDSGSCGRLSGYNMSYWFGLEAKDLHQNDVTYTVDLHLRHETPATIISRCRSKEPQEISVPTQVVGLGKEAVEAYVKHELSVLLDKGVIEPRMPGKFEDIKSDTDTDRYEEPNFCLDLENTIINDPVVHT